MKKCMVQWAFWPAILTMVMVSSMAWAQVEFLSEFTAADGTLIGNLSEWTATFASAGTTSTVDNNRGKMSFNGSGWINSNFRAAQTPSGDALAFNPITAGGIRFEVDVMSVTDGGTGYSGNSTTSIFLSTNPSWTNAAAYVSGEKLAATAIWNRNTTVPGQGGANSTFTISLAVINRYDDGTPDYHQYGADSGVVMQSFTVPVIVSQGDRVKFALEVCERGGNDVRIGYKIYDGIDAVWSDWTYSSWYNPKNAPTTDPLNNGVDINYNAFKSDWKTRWASNTYFYIEGYAAKNYIVDMWIDNALAQAGEAPPAPEDDMGIFTSRFDGPDGAPISVADGWTLAYGCDDCNEVIMNNSGFFEQSNSSWTYAGIRSDRVFDSMTPDGLRFQYTVVKMDDPCVASGTENAAARLCLAPERGWAASAWNQAGEKIVFSGVWNRTASTVGFSLRLCNNKDVPPDTDIGTVVWSATEAAMPMNTGAMFDLAVEVRDAADSNDIRAGYRVFRPATNQWSEWVYSAWVDPTNDELAYYDSDFLLDWKERWQKNTFFYIEAYSPQGRSGHVYVDNSYVIEINRPRTCAELWLYSPDAALAGDMDRDCDVDLVDLASWLTQWLECNDPLFVGSGCTATW